MMRTGKMTAVVLRSVLLLTACGGRGQLGDECDPANRKSCADGLSCEVVVGGDPANACFRPMVLVGDVFDAETKVGIGGAHVIALNEEGFAVSDVAVTDAAGRYELEAPARRSADGTPHPTAVYTLRAEAADYLPFPSGLRTALPINASTVVEEEERFVLDLPLTDVALIELPVEQQTDLSISGQVRADDGRGGGVLIVAEGPVVLSSISDREGFFTIFNVPDGTYTLRGYAADVQIEPKSVEVAGTSLEEVILDESSKPLSTLSGTLQIVNAPGGLTTSVVLVVASTFNDTFVRGDIPPGLRAPRFGTPSITGQWSIEGVPDGQYFVLAAFENDRLVRDPDPNISGTQIVSVTVPGATTDLSIADSFKITEALEVIGPGVDAPEPVGLKPTFRWKDDSSEDLYQIVVYDAFGDEVWRVDDLPEVTGSAQVSVEYGGPELEVGMYYQFRATSVRVAGSNKPNNMRPPGPISTTEDLRGVFFVQP